MLLRTGTRMRSRILALSRCPFLQKGINYLNIYAFEYLYLSRYGFMDNAKKFYKNVYCMVKLKSIMFMK